MKKISQIILSKIFGASTDKDNPGDVNPEENITRYIFQKKAYAQNPKPRVKYASFLPASDGHSSVFRTDNLKDNQIWELGVNFVEKKRKDNKKLLARADIQAISIFESGLTIEPDTKPHKLHANIASWPIENSEKKLIALELSTKAKLFIKSST